MSRSYARFHLWTYLSWRLWGSSSCAWPVTSLDTDRVHAPSDVPHLAATCWVHRWAWEMADAIVKMLVSRNIVASVALFGLLTWSTSVTNACGDGHKVRHHLDYTTCIVRHPGHSMYVRIAEVNLPKIYIFCSRSRFLLWKFLPTWKWHMYILKNITIKTCSY